MPDSILAKIGLYFVLPVAVLSVAGWKLYSEGAVSGKAQIQHLWDVDSAKRDKATQLLKDQYAQKEKQHAAESQQADLNLQKANDAHQLELANAKHEFDERLRSSEARSAIYQRQAAGGSTECQRLASHTAELDRSLEEGRQLVRELRDTLRLRDEQLVQVGNQLLADRKLYGDTDNHE